MNLYKSKNIFGIKLKKLKILNSTKAKSFSQKHFFSSKTKNKTPNQNKIPYLLKKIPNNENIIPKIPTKYELLSIIQKKKSKKNFFNLSRYLHDEPSKVDLNYNNNIESDSESALNILNETPLNNFVRNLKNKCLYKYQNIEDDSSLSKRNIFKKKFKKNSLNNSLFKNIVKNSSKINIKNILYNYKNNYEKNKSEFIKNKLNIIPTKKKSKEPKEIKAYDYYEENNKYNIKYEKPKIKHIDKTNLELFNKILKKRPKRHSRRFSKSLFDIQYENEKFHNINEYKDKNYFNKNNSIGLIKHERIKNGDLIESFNKIKNFNDNEEFILEKLK